jgi:hypothetical protein
MENENKEQILKRFRSRLEKDWFGGFIFNKTAAILLANTFHVDDLSTEEKKMISLDEIEEQASEVWDAWESESLFDEDQDQDEDEDH